MTQICEKWLRRNKWLSCVRIGLNNWEMAQKCQKRLMYVRKDLDIWEMA